MPISIGVKKGQAGPVEICTTLFEGDATRKDWASASSINSSSYLAQDAFNGTIGSALDAWISGDGAGEVPNINGQCWWQIDCGLGNEQTLYGVKFHTRAQTAGYNYPKVFHVLGSNTGSFSGEETTLLIAEAPDDIYADEDSEMFLFTAVGLYRYYRMEIHSMYKKGGSANWVSLAEVIFCGS